MSIEPSKNEYAHYCFLAQEATKNGGDKRINLLDNTERKTLSVMLRAIDPNQKKVKDEPIPSGRLNSIKEKLTGKRIEPEPHPLKKLINKIRVTVRNFFKLRTSSKMLMKEIDSTRRINIPEMKNAFIQHEKEKVQSHLEELKKSFNKEEIAIKKEELNLLENGHQKQFVEDFGRPGTLVKIDDDKGMGKFKGSRGAYNDKEFSKEKYLKFHMDGLENAFKKEKKKWMLLAEINLHQGTQAWVTNPIRSILYKNLGKKVNFAGKDYFHDSRKLNQGSKRYQQIKVLRDENEKIQHLNVKVTFRNKASLYSDDGEDLHLGYISSELSYSVMFEDDEETPKVTDVKYNNSFTVQEPDPPEIETEDLKPGFHPADT